MEIYLGEQSDDFGQETCGFFSSQPWCGDACGHTPRADYPPQTSSTIGGTFELMTNHWVALRHLRTNPCFGFWAWWVWGLFHIQLSIVIHSDTPFLALCQRLVIMKKPILVWHLIFDPRQCSNSHVLNDCRASLQDFEPRAHAWLLRKAHVLLAGLEGSHRVTLVRLFSGNVHSAEWVTTWTQSSYIRDIPPGYMGSPNHPF